jgi:hypothetical protein
VSTDIALHFVITHTEEAAENIEVTCGAFLDVEEALDTTSHIIITEAAKWNGCEGTICQWTSSLWSTGK